MLKDSTAVLHTARLGALPSGSTINNQRGEVEVVEIGTLEVSESRCESCRCDNKHNGLGAGSEPSVWGTGDSGSNTRRPDHFTFTLRSKESRFAVRGGKEAGASPASVTYFATIMSEHKLCVDVDYDETHARIAGLVFRDWEDEEAVETHQFQIANPADYIPGEFYRRELPCIEALLDRVTLEIDTIVVDSYVWLEDGPGMGGHLFQALEERVAVVGVAKNSFFKAVDAVPLLRGSTKKPLFISAAGMAVEEAAAAIAKMHGPFRLPTLLKQVDRLCRDFVG